MSRPPSPSGPRDRRLRRLSEATTFIAGAAILGSQMAVGSEVAAMLGVSTLAWAATIAVVLLSLSVGYWLGDCVADRRPEPRSFWLLVLTGALALLINAPALRALLQVARGLGASLGAAFILPLAAGVALLALPMILLGAVLPYAVRLQLAGAVNGGGVVGRFYALSTGGSLAGTFLAVLVLTPLLGAVRACMALGVAVAGAGLTALVRGRSSPGMRARASRGQPDHRPAHKAPVRAVIYCLCADRGGLAPFRRGPKPWRARDAIAGARSRSSGRAVNQPWPLERHATVAFDEHRLRRRLIGAVVITAAIISLLLGLPPLRHVAATIAHISPGWLGLAVALELASSASFVIVFRLFFDRIPAPAARELAWTEMGAGALLPGGGVGAYAIGGWLLHRAGMSARRIIERSSALFFLTSAANAAALFLGGVLLTAGIGHGPHDFPRAALPVIISPIGIAIVLALPGLCSSGRIRRYWLRDLVCGIRGAQRALTRPHWRLSGAVGYLGFDIAVLWVTFAATGHQLPAGALIVAYIVGYLANLIPIPVGVGVLEGGLAGMLVLYGAPVAQAAAAVLVYHAIAFWIPSLGGLAAYSRLRQRMRHSAAPPAWAAPPSEPAVTLVLPEPETTPRPRRASDAPASLKPSQAPPPPARAA